MEKYICIHGHFYQPPRENAWLEEIELQESAHPYHDWNERITDECYGPNTASRILNGKGQIIEITNNYSKISFNFGPTLLSWLQDKSPLVYDRILEADRLSMARFGGHGSAVAQVYNHIIMPLATRRDKETQVIWGIKDFESRFNRMPEGMWLAETAVDTETLEVLAENNIKYTILAPHQAAKFKFGSHSEFLNTDEKALFTGIPYKINLPSGKSIYVYFYDGEKSQAVAFNNLLDDGQRFADELLTGFQKDWEGKQLVHIATDGESYGHHHKHGDMALSYCLDTIEKSGQAVLTNYGQFLELADVLGEAEIVENSSWSCAHGVERWRADCGCNTGGGNGYSQSWRGPLRESLDWLRDEVDAYFFNDEDNPLNDPTDARNKYIEIILNRKVDKVHTYLETHPEESGSIIEGLRWLEAQRHSLLMYTSCGWFFDEVSGIETTQIMQYASRLMQLVYQLTGRNLEPEFLERLEKAPSNLSEFENARKVYEAMVAPTRLSLERVGMHYAALAIFNTPPDDFKIFNYTAKKEYLSVKEAGTQKLISGIINVQSDVTYSHKKFLFAALYMGQHNIIGNISINMSDDNFMEATAKMENAFAESRIGDLIGDMEDNFTGQRFTLWHLFRDQKQEVISKILEINLRQVENSFRKIYDRDYQLVNMMKNSQIPVPHAYLTTIEYILNSDLRNCFRQEDIDMAELERIQEEFEKWNVNLEDRPIIEKISGERINAEMITLTDVDFNYKRIQKLNAFFNHLRKLDIRPGLSTSQNVYFRYAKDEVLSGKRKDQDWLNEFVELGNNLGVEMEEHVL